MNRTLFRPGQFAASLCLALALFAALPVDAAVRLPRIFGSDMVFQRDLPLPVWGWAEPGEGVTCELGEAKATSVANAQGEWMVKLPAMSAGGPFEMEVRGGMNNR